MFASYVFTSCFSTSVLLVFPLPLNRVSDELSAILTSVLEYPFISSTLKRRGWRQVVYPTHTKENFLRKILTCALRIELRIVRLEGESASTYTNQLPKEELP